MPAHACVAVRVTQLATRESKDIGAFGEGSSVWYKLPRASA